jgi:hypothetical protein
MRRPKKPRMARDSLRQGTREQGAKMTVGAGLSLPGDSKATKNPSTVAAGAPPSPRSPLLESQAAGDPGSGRSPAKALTKKKIPLRSRGRRSGPRPPDPVRPLSPSGISWLQCGIRYRRGSAVRVERAVAASSPWVGTARVLGVSRIWDPDPAHPLGLAVLRWWRRVRASERDRPFLRWVVIWFLVWSLCRLGGGIPVPRRRR